VYDPFSTVCPNDVIIDFIAKFKRKLPEEDAFLVADRLYLDWVYLSAYLRKDNSNLSFSYVVMTRAKRVQLVLWALLTGAPSLA
jgi:hypothetical protein